MNVIKKDNYKNSLPKINIFVDSSYYSFTINTTTMKVKESFWKNDKFS